MSKDGKDIKSFLILKATDAESVRAVSGSYEAKAAGEDQASGGVGAADSRTAPVVATATFADDETSSVHSDACNNKL